MQVRQHSALRMVTNPKSCGVVLVGSRSLKEMPMSFEKPTRTFLLFALAAVSACASNTVSSDADSAGPSPGTNTGVNPPAASAQDADWAAIEKLEGEAKAIAKTGGCSDVAGCRTAPVGSRACGGPRYYIPYCATATDSAALYRKLDEVAAAERAYNTKYQMASTCEFRMPPELTLTGGACAAK